MHRACGQPAAQSSPGIDRSLLWTIPVKNRHELVFACPKTNGSAFGVAVSNDKLSGNCSAVHLELEFDDRWTTIVPGQAGMGGATLYDFVGQKRIQVVHSVDLRRCRIAPARPKCSKTTFHFPKNVTRLLAHAFRADIAVPNAPVSYTH